MKDVEFVGDSLDQLRNFPVAARRTAGLQLRRVQQGFAPVHWKPMPSVGAGVREIRIRDEDGQYRVVYVANLGNTVYVLHAFQKKSQKTAKPDIALIKQRLIAVKRLLR